MRLTVVSGDKQVHVRVKGNGRKKLRQAEAAARRLLDATPEPVAKLPMGFSAVSDTDTVED
ncbi:hypothetical protein ABZX65_26690 [Streptomyces sp. NPDC003300]|uniref:hypothetical protein n=1 Tax=unclassified Streptomyces TaxID=2593676 RepID=UPI0033A031CB